MRKMMLNRTSVWTVLWLISIVLVLLSGCSSLKSKRSATPVDKPPKTAAKAENVPTYYDFGDVLVPKELEVDKKNSFVFRTPGLTVGILALKGRVQASSLPAFFENKMPVDGWRLISSIEGQRTMMLFQKNNRWCVINISEGQFNTTVEIWVSTSVNSPGFGGITEGGVKGLKK